MPSSCPLCYSHQINLFTQDKKREYFRCSQCDLIFVDRNCLLSSEDEKAIYDYHENNIFDANYRQFLNRLFQPLTDSLSPGSSGLDFGCGPGPALAHMFLEAGYSMAIYDPYYAPIKHVLTKQYDFVTSTEAIEHFALPGEEITRLDQCLKPGGQLGIMTKLTDTVDNFKNWHYKNDPTHINFFSQQTFKWLANKLNYSVQFYGVDTIVLTKRN